MRTKLIIVTLIIILTPFIIGMVLYATLGNIHAPAEDHLIAGAKINKENLSYKGLSLDWVFCPDWEYKPLLFPAEEYLVFMFHYTNNNDYTVQVTPSYSFVSPKNRRYPANEEISMYIEDALETDLKTEDVNPFAFKISPNGTKHYIVTFEKPRSLESFYVDIDIFRDLTWRLYYKKVNGHWKNYTNKLVAKYKGRG